MQMHPGASGGGGSGGGEAGGDGGLQKYVSEAEQYVPSHSHSSYPPVSTDRTRAVQHASLGVLLLQAKLRHAFPPPLPPLSFAHVHTRL